MSIVLLNLPVTFRNQCRDVLQKTLAQSGLVPDLCTTTVQMRKQQQAATPEIKKLVRLYDGEADAVTNSEARCKHSRASLSTNVETQHTKMMESGGRTKTSSSSKVLFLCLF